MQRLEPIKFEQLPKKNEQVSNAHLVTIINDGGFVTNTDQFVTNSDKKVNGEYVVRNFIESIHTFTNPESNTQENLKKILSEEQLQKLTILNGDDLETLLMEVLASYIKNEKLRRDFIKTYSQDIQSYFQLFQDYFLLQGIKIEQPLDFNVNVREENNNLIIEVTGSKFPIKSNDDSRFIGMIDNPVRLTFTMTEKSLPIENADQEEKKVVGYAFDEFDTQNKFFRGMILNQEVNLEELKTEYCTPEKQYNLYVEILEKKLTDEKISNELRQSAKVIFDKIKQLENQDLALRAELLFLLEQVLINPESRLKDFLNFAYRNKIEELEVPIYHLIDAAHASVARNNINTLEEQAPEYPQLTSKLREQVRELSEATTEILDVKPMPGDRSIVSLPIPSKPGNAELNSASNPSFIDMRDNNWRFPIFNTEALLPDIERVDSLRFAGKSFREYLQDEFVNSEQGINKFIIKLDQLDNTHEKSTEFQSKIGKAGNDPEKKLEVILEFVEQSFATESFLKDFLRYHFFKLTSEPKDDEVFEHEYEKLITYAQKIKSIAKDAFEILAVTTSFKQKQNEDLPKDISYLSSASVTSNFTYVNGSVTFTTVSSDFRIRGRGRADEPEMYKIPGVLLIEFSPTLDGYRLVTYNASNSVIKKIGLTSDEEAYKAGYIPNELANASNEERQILNRLLFQSSSSVKAIWQQLHSNVFKLGEAQNVLVQSKDMETLSELASVLIQDPFNSTLIQHMEEFRNSLIKKLRQKSTDEFLSLPSKFTKDKQLEFKALLKEFKKIPNFEAIIARHESELVEFFAEHDAVNFEQKLKLLIAKLHKNIPDNDGINHNKIEEFKNSASRVFKENDPPYSLHLYFEEARRLNSKLFDDMFNAFENGQQDKFTQAFKEVSEKLTVLIGEDKELQTLFIEFKQNSTRKFAERQAIIDFTQPFNEMLQQFIKECQNQKQQELLARVAKATTKFQPSSASPSPQHVKEFLLLMNEVAKNPANAKLVEIMKTTVIDPMRVPGNTYYVAYRAAQLELSLEDHLMSPFGLKLMEEAVTKHVREKLSRDGKFDEDSFLKIPSNYPPVEGLRSVIDDAVRKKPGSKETHASEWVDFAIIKATEDLFDKNGNIKSDILLILNSFLPNQDLKADDITTKRQLLSAYINDVIGGSTKGAERGIAADLISKKVMLIDDFTAAAVEKRIDDLLEALDDPKYKATKLQTAIVEFAYTRSITELNTVSKYKPKKNDDNTYTYDPQMQAVGGLIHDDIQQAYETDPKMSKVKLTKAARIATATIKAPTESDNFNKCMDIAAEIQPRSKAGAIVGGLVMLGGLALIALGIVGMICPPAGLATIAIGAGVTVAGAVSIGLISAGVISTIAGSLTMFKSIRRKKMREDIETLGHQADVKIKNTPAAK